MNVKNLILGIGIFTVFMLMLNYGIEAFYNSPKYTDFCKNTGERYPISVKLGGELARECTFNKTLQEKSDKCFLEGGYPIYSYNESGCLDNIKECNFCEKEFNESNKLYAKSLFIISIIVGIITLLVGFMFLSAEPVSSALMASGVGAIFYGSARNWENLADIWRFLLLFAALMLLIWIALHINKKEKNRIWNFWKK